MVQGRIIIILHIICIIIVNEWSFLNWDFFRCWMELPLAGISGSREPDPPLPAAAPPAGNAPPQRVPTMRQPPLKCRVAKCFICLVVFSEEELAENILKTVNIFLLKRDCPTRSEWITKLCYVVNTCMNIHICYRYCCCGSGKISSNIWLPPTCVKKNAKPPSPSLIVPPVPR